MSGYDHPANLKAADGLFEDQSRFEDEAGSPTGEPADTGKPSSQWEGAFAADEGVALADGGLAGGAESDVFGGEAIRLGPTGPVPLLVQFEYGTTADQSMALFQELGASNVRIIRAENAADHLGTLYRIELPDSAASAEQIEAISSRAPVSYAEPDFAVSIDATSNDPGVVGGSLWGMYGDQSTIANPYGSQAAEAWEGGHTGSSGTVVGVIDTGIDYTHEDLYLNIWLNQREIPVALRDTLVDSDSDGLITFRDLNATANSSFVRDVNANGRIDAGDLLNDSAWENGVDEDGNGRVDDLIGWDFVNNDNDPYDDQGHGTHVSGTIGGIGGNGVGVAGVNWDVQLVGLKFLDANGSGYTSDAVQAVDYFTDAARNAVQGEHFVATNNSWGGGGYSRTLDAAVARGAAQDILFVAAAGNESQNTDISPNYPSNLSTTQAAGYEAVVSVASLTSSGQLSSFSNYGTQTVDLAAPGSTIYSTLPGDRYGAYSGTSMATPHVTGAIALYASANPNASAADVRAALLSTTVETNSLTGKVANAGRLDVSQLLGVDTAPTPEPPPPAPTDLIAGDASTTAILAAGVATASSIDFGGDQDWFRVSLHAGYTYDMALDAPSGSALDTYLRLLDGAGNTLAANDDAVGLNSRLSFTVDADGTYFVSAQGYGSSTGDFVLAMSETAPPPLPVDTIAGDASTTATLVAGTAEASSIDFGGDQDWFQVSLRAGYTYDLALDAASGSALDTYLRLLDGAGNTLAANDDAVGLNSRLSFTADADGTYFVSAQGYGSSTGDFVLAMSETAPPPAPVDTIAGDASTTATLAAGVAEASSIDFGGDQDWFQVSLRAGYTYDLALDAASGSALDTYLRLLDGAGNTLAANDDAVGLNSRLSFTADADGTYFVSAQGYGSSTGEFVLAMSETLNSGETIVGNNRGNRLYGTSGGDEIYGLRGNDTLFGREGNDQIYGGYGNDRLIGGDGSDTFVFDTVLNRRYNVDRIYDFSDTEDSFLLDHLIFGQFDAATGVTNENIAIGSHAFDGNDYLIYNPSNGGLYYDANGSDRGGQQLFAVLATGLDLNADHFLIG